MKLKFINIHWSQALKCEKASHIYQDPIPLWMLCKQQKPACPHLSQGGFNFLCLQQRWLSSVFWMVHLFLRHCSTTGILNTGGKSVSVRSFTHSLSFSSKWPFKPSAASCLACLCCCVCHCSPRGGERFLICPTAVPGTVPYDMEQSYAAISFPEGVIFFRI